MSENDDVTVVVTGMQEERCKYNWKIQHLGLIQKDEMLLENQKFEIDTGKGTQLQSRWEVGFKNDKDSYGRHIYYIYCKLVDILSLEGLTELVARFTVKLVQPNGNFAWNVEQHGRKKINEEFNLLQTNYYYNGESHKWNSYEDSFGAVTFYIELNMLKPLEHDTNQSNKASTLEKKFKLNSSAMAHRNLACLLVTNSCEFDVKIVCSDGKELKCHKIILNSYSPVFKTMMSSDLSEAKSGVVRINDVSGKTMEVLLQYLYTGELLAAWKETDVIVKFVYAAGKYQLKELLDFLDNILGHVNEDPTALLALLELANKLSLKNAETRLMGKIGKFLISAKSSSEILSAFTN